MPEAEDGGLARPGIKGPYGDLLFRLVSVAALALGTLSGVTTLSSADDRYRAADASKDFQIRDSEIKYIWSEITDLKTDVDRIDRGGAARPTEALEQKVSSLDSRLDHVESMLGKQK